MTHRRHAPRSRRPCKPGPGDDRGAARARSPTSSVQPIAGKRLGPWGFDVAGMDRSVASGRRLLPLASGNWARSTQIPADRSSFGSFNVLGDLSEARVRQLVENYRQGDTNADRSKVAALYGSFMDEARVESLGAQPLQPLCSRSARRRPRSRSPS
jgi:predicted metalloendopeptidase